MINAATVRTGLIDVATRAVQQSERGMAKLATHVPQLNHPAIVPYRGGAALGLGIVLLIAILNGMMGSSDEPTADMPPTESASVAVPPAPHSVTIKTPARPGSSTIQTPVMDAGDMPALDTPALSSEASDSLAEALAKSQNEPETASGDQVVVPLATQLRQWQRSTPTLASAPQPDLMVGTPEGNLPRVAADGREAWRVYARPAPPVPKDVPQIAILMVDMGLSQRQTIPAIEQLPGQISLALHAYTPDLTDLIAAARADGHEVLVDIPAEPVNYPDDDPGPDALLTRLPIEQNLRRLRTFMAKAPGIVGVISTQGTRYTTDGAALTPVLQELTLRGLGWVDVNPPALATSTPASLVEVSPAASTTPRTVTQTLVPSLGTASASADLWLDQKLSPAAMTQLLLEAVRLAKQNGHALIIARPYPLSVSLLNEFIEGLPQLDVALVPASALLRKGGTTAGR